MHSRGVVSQITEHVFLTGVRGAKQQLPYDAALAILDFDMGPPAWAKRYAFFELCDQQDESSELFWGAVNGGVDFITRCVADGLKVVVYCGLGVSRSAAVVTAYVMRSQKRDFGEALAIVRKARDVVRPNPGFSTMLRDMK